MNTKKRTAKNSGSTMVELIVAFAIVLLATASWSKVVTVTTDLVNRATAMRDQRILFEKCYYLNQTQTDATGTYQMTVETGQTYVLVPVKESGEVLPGADAIGLPITLEEEKLQKTTEGETRDAFSIYVAK